MNKLPNILLGIFGLIILVAIVTYNGPTRWYKTYTLSNGMEVIVIPNHKIPAVSHMVWYHVGSKDEEKGKSGLAHFLEHLMFKGTPKYPDGKFSKLVAENAGEENAMTSHDYTAYFQKIEKSKLPLVMDLESDRMINLQLTAEQVASENKVILEERRTRYDNTPRMLLMEQLDAAVFGPHPYGIQPIGNESEMSHLPREEALSFYKKYYHPNNATLIVAGDVTPSEVIKLAKKYYGRIPEGEEIKRIDMPLPAVIKREVELVDSRVKQPELWRKYMAPGFVFIKPELAVPLVIISRILGEGNSSRLYQSLVVEQKIAVATGTNYDGLNVGPADFSVYALPAQGVSIATLRKAIDVEINKIAKEGVTKEELERAKKALTAEMTYSREGLQGLSFITGQVISVGLTPEFVTNLPVRINATTLDEVNGAANLVFTPRFQVNGVLKGK